VGDSCLDFLMSPMLGVNGYSASTYSTSAVGKAAAVRHGCRRTARQARRNCIPVHSPARPNAFMMDVFVFNRPNLGGPTVAGL